MSAIALAFADADAAAATMRCSACGDEGPHRPLVDAANPCRPGERVRFLRCRACASVIVGAGTIIEYTDAGDFDDAFWRHYVHVGAGIDVMTSFADRARGGRAKADLFEVGCGYGYVLDWWRASRFGVAVGVEPSAYGSRGRAALGVDIRAFDIVADDAPSHLDGRRFDVLLACEVIEHVADPAAFIAALPRFLAADGVAVLTTPDAAFVDPANPSIHVAAALSVGVHKFLYSRAAFEAALRAGGFAHVRVEVAYERLIAFASRAPLPDTALAPDFRGRVLRWLDARGRDPLEADDRIGFQFRTLRDAWHLGEFEIADGAAARLSASVAEAYGFDLRDTAAALARSCDARDLAAYIGALPTVAGPARFYLALVDARRGEHERAAAGCAAVWALWRALPESIVVHSQELVSLLWHARLQEGVQRAGAGDLASALRAFDSLLDDASEPAARALIVPDPALVESARQLRARLRSPSMTGRLLRLLLAVQRELRTRAAGGGSFGARFAGVALVAGERSVRALRRLGARKL